MQAPSIMSLQVARGALAWHKMNCSPSWKAFQQHASVQSDKLALVRPRSSSACHRVQVGMMHSSNLGTWCMVRCWCLLDINVERKGWQWRAKAPAGAPHMHPLHVQPAAQLWAPRGAIQGALQPLILVSRPSNMHVGQGSSLVHSPAYCPQPPPERAFSGLHHALHHHMHQFEQL